jgi:hypothetical protein
MIVLSNTLRLIVGHSLGELGIISADYKVDQMNLTLGRRRNGKGMNLRGERQKQADEWEILAMAYGSTSGGSITAE